MTEIVIDSKRFYTLGEIVREKLIPGMDSIPKIARLIHTDTYTTKILNGFIVKRGARGIQYKVKGSNIIKYLSSIDNG